MVEIESMNSQVANKILNLSQYDSHMDKNLKIGKIDHIGQIKSKSELGNNTRYEEYKEAILT